MALQWLNGMLLIHSRTVGSWAVQFTDLILDVWEVQMSFDTQRLWNLASQSNGWFDRWLWSRACEKSCSNNRWRSSRFLHVLVLKRNDLSWKANIYRMSFCHLKSKSNHHSWTANIYLWQASLFGKQPWIVWKQPFIRQPLIRFCHAEKPAFLHVFWFRSSLKPCCLVSHPWSSLPWTSWSSMDCSLTATVAGEVLLTLQGGHLFSNFVDDQQCITVNIKLWTMVISLAKHPSPVACDFVSEGNFKLLDDPDDTNDGKSFLEKMSAMLDADVKVRGVFGTNWLYPLGCWMICWPNCHTTLRAVWNLIWPVCVPNSFVHCTNSLWLCATFLKSFALCVCRDTVQVRLA